MEALGIIASVIQVSDFGLALAAHLYQFIDSAGSANRDIQFIAKDLSIFSTVLKQLAEALEKGPRYRPYQPDVYKISLRVVRECDSIFREIERIIKKSTSKGASLTGTSHTLQDENTLTLNFLGKVMWVYRRARVQFLRSNLESLKSTIMLELVLLNHADRNRPHRYQLIMASIKRRLGHKKVNVDDEVAITATEAYQKAKKSQKRKTTMADPHNVELPTRAESPMSIRSADPVSSLRIPKGKSSMLMKTSKPERSDQEDPKVRKGATPSDPAEVPSATLVREPGPQRSSAMSVLTAVSFAAVLQRRSLKKHPNTTQTQEVISNPGSSGERSEKRSSRSTPPGGGAASIEKEPNLKRSPTKAPLTREPSVTGLTNRGFNKLPKKPSGTGVPLLQTHESSETILIKPKPEDEPKSACF